MPQKKSDITPLTFTSYNDSKPHRTGVKSQVPPGRTQGCNAHNQGRPAACLLEVGRQTRTENSTHLCDAVACVGEQQYQQRLQLRLRVHPQPLENEGTHLQSRARIKARFRSGVSSSSRSGERIWEVPARTQRRGRWSRARSARTAPRLGTHLQDESRNQCMEVESK